MDLHLPHEPVRTWRDALVHRNNPGIGLFVELEAVVESVHHRDLVRGARENIRREIVANQQVIQEDIASIGEEAAHVDAGLKTMRSVRAHSRAEGQSIIFQWAYSDLSDAAWQTAGESGALGFIPYAEVQQDASLNPMQDQAVTPMQSLATRRLDLLPPMIADCSRTMPTH